MAQKILIVEDIDSISEGVRAWVGGMFPTADIRATKYCDEALMKVNVLLQNLSPLS